MDRESRSTASANTKCVQTEHTSKPLFVKSCLIISIWFFFPSRRGATISPSCAKNMRVLQLHLICYLRLSTCLYSAGSSTEVPKCKERKGNNPIVASHLHSINAHPSPNKRRQSIQNQDCKIKKSSISTLSQIIKAPLPKKKITFVALRPSSAPTVCSTPPPGSDHPSLNDTVWTTTTHLRRF